MTLTVDTLNIYNRLKSTGLSEESAKAIAEIFREAIEELQLSIAFYSSNHRAIELVDKVKRMKESFYYTKKGNKQIKIGNFQNARISFQRALELDPENQEAKEMLKEIS